LYERPRKAISRDFRIEGTVIVNDGWYALHVRPRAERVAARHLEDKGYRPFVPFFRSRRRWSDRVREIQLPLFPNYVFCEVTDTAVGRIVTTPGVIRIVGAGNVPIPIDASEIDALKRVVAVGNDVRPWPFLQVGQRVEILAGPLRAVRGIVARFGNSNRLVVSISLLQRSVAVELEGCDVLPMWDAHPSLIAAAR
jgi:transcription antitermination factor NusG